MKHVQGHRVPRGFSLIEVLIAIVVLSFGLLALAALSGSLLRAGAEAKARANASALAQQVIEEARAFSFVSAPAGYNGPTYEKLASWTSPRTVAMGGVSFTVNRSVARYSPSGSVVSGTFDPASAEFKVVDVAVGWTGADGQAKTVTLRDSIPALSPADALSVLKLPTAGSQGPNVWVEPPNKDNPAVVPIAVGDDQSAASSNPVPRRFTKQDSNTAATVFSVHTFTGSPDGTEVLLNRKLDVAAVTCKCELGGTSTSLNPAYEPVVWSGKQLAYLDPRPLPAGTKIGRYEGGQSTKDIDEMCTACCRDHHESSSRLQRPDPYRALVSPEVPGAEHYLVSSTTSAPGQPVFTGPLTTGEYSEACQLIRVNGRMRVSIDPMQNMLVTVRMNDAKTSQEIEGSATFANLYSKLVVDYLSKGVESLPVGYLSPTARFPAFDEASYLPDFAPILTPSPVVLPTSTGLTEKQLVSFGLYIDYLSQDTLTAYNCAATKSSDASCNGLRERNPLVTLPFFAINVANLGVWKADASMFPAPNRDPTVTVSSPLFDNKGILSGAGGVVKVATAAKPAPCTKLSLSITRSSSGVAGRLPIDKDDNLPANWSLDSLWFTEKEGATNDNCVEWQR